MNAQSGMDPWPERRPLRRDAQRNYHRLLDEARVVMAEQGPDASLEEIARRASVGIGTLYRHFPTRDDLIRALYDRALAELADIAPEVLGAPTAWQGLVVFIERVSEWIIADPGLPAIMQRMAVITPDYRPAGRFEEPIAALVARAKAEGELRADVDPVDVTVIVTMLGSLGRYGDGYREHWRRQLAIVLDGLRAPGHEPTELPGVALHVDDFHRIVHDAERVSPE
ncbi:TetR/AcrR family transcriptional regulator [Luethyella okanaganae]|uniref:TetR/AcrR family transcriptional regulator n=1 Tax=Luethyella okanaganae TaxID=69372 RepID=A0ABW1VE33_9MICO